MLDDDDDDESLSELEDEEDEEDDEDEDEDDDGDRFRRFVVGSAASILGFCSGQRSKNELRGSSGQTSVLSGRFCP